MSKVPYRLRQPEKYKARNKVASAIKRGLLPRASMLTCHTCGQPADSYHHHKGYAPENSLDVIPLCWACHVEVDKLYDDGLRKASATLRMANEDLEYPSYADFDEDRGAPGFVERLEYGEPS